MSANSDDDAFSSGNEEMTTLLDLVSPTTEKINDGVANEERLYNEVSDEIERKLQQLQLTAERERGARPKVPSASTLDKNDDKVRLMKVDGKMNENDSRVSSVDCKFGQSICNNLKQEAVTDSKEDKLRGKYLNLNKNHRECDEISNESYHTFPTQSSLSKIYLLKGEIHELMTARELSRAGEGENTELLERELDRSQRDLERAVTAKQRLQELYRDRAQELRGGEQRVGERGLMKEYFSGVEEIGRLEEVERCLRKELKAMYKSEAKLQWELDSLGCLSRPNQWAVGAPYGRSRAPRSGR